MTIYTGVIPVEHGAGQDITRVTFEYPLLGSFQPAGVGIFPINDPSLGRVQFRSAVADACIESFDDKSETTRHVITEPNGSEHGSESGGARADLFKIILEPQKTIIHAVVLSGDVWAREAHVYTVAFRVSVLERMTNNPEVKAPIISRGPAWSGEYDKTNDGHVGVMVMPGVPQR